MGVEDEVVVAGEGECLGLGFRGLELDAPEAARVPVAVVLVGEDLEGEHGGGAQGGVQELDEVVGRGGYGDVGDAHGGCVGCECLLHWTLALQSDTVILSLSLSLR